MRPENLHHPTNGMTLSLVALLVLWGAAGLAGQVPQNGNAKERPEIVLVSYAEGEVKLSPGKNGVPMLGGGWIQATPGQPIEDGNTVATEKGRAEIEFENGTVVYLAEGAVLQFKKLRAGPGMTDVQLGLVTGTATIVHVSRGHDMMQIQTPATSMGLPETQTVRVQSALDGTVIQAVDGEVPFIGFAPEGVVLKPGESVVVVWRHLNPLKGIAAIPGGDEWDHWVNARRLKRHAALEQGVNETGLEAPTPGLADMVENGTFFDCAPYGKCWEPVEKAEQAGAVSVLGAPGGPPPTTGQSTGTGRRDFVISKKLLERCPMEVWMYSAGRPGVAGLSAAGEAEETFFLRNFATCYSGEWVRTTAKPCRGPYQVRTLAGECKPHWKWVVGSRRRKKEPVHFVKVGKGIGIAHTRPINPKGASPKDATSRVLVLTEGRNGLQAKTVVMAAKDIRVEQDLPRGFMRNPLEGLPQAERPAIQGRLIETAVDGGRHAVTPTALQKGEANIRYDYKTRNFVALGDRTGGTRGREAATVVAHMGGSGVQGTILYSGNNGGSRGGGGGFQSSAGGALGDSRGYSSGGGSRGAGGGEFAGGGGSGDSRGASQSSSASSSGRH